MRIRAWMGIMALGIAAAGRAEAGPVEDYNAKVKRLEQAHVEATGNPQRVGPAGEALLRAHLEALKTPATAAAGLFAAGMTLDSIVLDCRFTGDDSAAPACFAHTARDAARQIEAATGPDDPRRFDLMMALGIALVQQGGYDTGAPLLDASTTARIARLSAEDGAEASGAIAFQLFQVASACRQIKRPVCHDRLVKPALARLEQKLGPDDARVSMALDEVGTAYLEPEPDGVPPQIAWARAVLEHKEDLELRHGQDAVRGSPPYLLYGAYLLQHDFAAAASLIVRLDVTGPVEKAVLEIPEEQIQLTVRAGRVEEINAAVSLSVVQAAKSPELGRAALSIVLGHKGEATDSQVRALAASRQSADPELVALLRRYAQAKASLASASMHAKDPREASRSRPLADDTRRLEMQIAERAAKLKLTGPRPPPSIDAVRAALAEGEALVELVRYRPIEGAILMLKAPADVTDEYDGFGPPRYAAFVLGKDGAVHGVDLGPAAAIEAAVTKLRAALGDEKIDPIAPARALDALTMARIRPLVGRARRLLVSPDAALGSIPFSALVDEKGRYLIEDWSFRYLPSGRDVITTARRPSKEGPVVAGDPDFGAAPAGGSDRGVRATSLVGVKFPPLPGTGEEAVSVAALLPAARTLLHAQASESALKSLHGPSVLHLATHGFFQSDASVSIDLADLKSTDNLADPLKTPMLRAGLALAGANRAAASGGDDGVLTALEATSLDLSGTRLVVLSACETGLGDPSAGEGVYGLRRALVMAGAETLVMSLWRVPDASTRDLMKAFYAELRRGAVPSEAMRKVSLTMLADGRAHKATSLRAHPRFWASFIVSGDDVPLGEVWQAPAPPAAVAPGSHACGCSLPGAAPPAAPALVAACLLALALHRRRASRRRHEPRS